MAILESEDQFATRNILLTIGIGVLFALFFGIPPALGARAMGLSWIPYCAAIIAAAAVVGFALAFLVVTFLLRPDDRVPTPPVSDRPTIILPIRLPAKARSGPFRQRLADEKAALDRLDKEREQRHRGDLGKATEERIIWNELLDLELQDIDEQIDRICSATEGAPHRSV